MPEEIYPIRFEVPSSVLVTWESWRGVGLPRLVNSTRYKIPHLEVVEPHKGRCVIVGGGPSVNAEFDNLKEIAEGSTVCSINGAHNWLVKRGIIPDIHVVYDFDIENIEDCLDGPIHQDTIYYIGSHCHENLYKQLEDYKVILYHAYAIPEEYTNALNLLFPNEVKVGGGFLTLFRTIAIAKILGYRNFNLFGVDSSFEGESSHVNGYTCANKEKELQVWARNQVTGELRQFRTTAGLARQADCFPEFCRIHNELDIKIYGDGLLSYIHKTTNPMGIKSEC